MVLDAEAHADEDRKRRDLVAARNSGDSLIYSSERTLRESGDKVEPVLRTRAEDQIRELRIALDADSDDEIRNRSAELATTMQQIGQSLYDSTPEGAGTTVDQADATVDQEENM
jgi:molecular chaperone DnaK